MSDPLLTWRSQFPILARTTYLISNSLGAMPQGVSRRLQEYAETWATKGVRAWADEWWDMPVRAGNEIAPLIGAGEGEISMHPNITLIEGIILSCFEGKDLGRRKRIVCESLNFPSVIYLMRQWAEAHGAEVALVDSSDGVTIDLQRMLDTIDERTLLVPLSHVLFKSAFIQDVRKIVSRAHDVGALVVLDAYQSAGIIPINVKDLGVDILVGGVLKWLCGGPGGAFLYVRPDLLKELSPRLTGWFAHPRPFDFDANRMEYRDDAFRFLNGTPAIPAIYAALEGPRIIREIGVGEIRRKSVRQTALAIQAAEDRGFRVNSPRNADERGGTVTLDVPHGYEVAQELIARNILVDYRKGAGIRLSPHFYNSDDEVTGSIEEIQDILRKGAFERHEGKRSFVT